MGEYRVTGYRVVPVFGSNSTASPSNNYPTYDFMKKLELERKEKERRKKMKKDPNLLRAKSKNKSTRPKWMDRKW